MKTIDWFRHNLEILWTAMFFFAWAFVFLLRQLPIGGGWAALDQRTSSLILAWVSATALAMFAGGRLARRRTGEARAANPDWAVYVLSLAALTGAVLIILEFAFVRGYGFSMPVAMIRILEVNRGMQGAASSLLSGTGRLMLPAFLPALILVAWGWKSLSRTALGVFALAAAAVLVEQIMFEGGRIFLGTTFIALAVALLADLLKPANPGGASFGRKLINMILILGIYGAIVFSYSGWLFSKRSEISGETQSAAFDRFSSNIIGEKPAQEPNAAPAPAAQPDAAPPANPAPVEKTGQAEAPGAAPAPETAAAPAPSDQQSAGAEAAKVEIPDNKWPILTRLMDHPTTKFFWIYATHGISELSKVLHFDDLKQTHGFFQFPQVSQVLDRVFGTGLRVDYYNDLPSVGLYTTMIGASYIDFGWAGAVLFGIGFGFLTGYCATSAMRQDGLSFAAIAFPVLMTAALVSPIVSIVNHIWPMIVWAFAAAFIARFADKKSRTAMMPA
jgi:hypothetical protein